MDWLNALLKGNKMTRLIACFTAIVIILGSWASPVAAKVHFGKNVRIGGHDVSNQTFTKKRRAVYHIYKGKPRRTGCRWRKNRDGSRTKICHFQRKKRRK